MQVVAYDEDGPSLMLSNGEVHQADVIIAADGELCLRCEIPESDQH